MESASPDITNGELLQFLDQEEMRARDNTLDDQRAALISFYNGDPYGDEEDGRSQLVTRDIAEVVDHMTVSVLRTMVSGDKFVEFEDSDSDDDTDNDDEVGIGHNGGPPMPPEPQAPPQDPSQPGQPQQAPQPPLGPKPPGFAQQATECVHYFFQKKGNGYRVLHDALKAGLLEKTGYVKIYAERPAPKKRHHIVPAELLNTMPIVAAEPVDVANEYGNWHVVTHDQKPVTFRAVTVPNEEMLVAPDCRNLEDAIYIAHRTPKTLSDLNRMGFDSTNLKDEGDGWIDAGLANARDGDRSWNGRTDIDRTGVNRMVWLLEEYVCFDLDGDGIAERLRIHRVGKTILEISEIDEHPFEYWCPFPMQHRLVGQSLADKVADIQRTNSVLLRNGMDSLYIGLAPRTYVNEASIGENTIDDLLTVRPNAIVRFKGERPETIVNQDTASTAFQAIEFMIGQRESRTGITRLNQGLAQDTLNKTAAGTAMMQAQGQQIEEYVARNFAEMLVAPMFQKMYRQMREYGSPFKMKIDGQLCMIDPRKWPEEMDINVRVGLGSGRKEQRLMYRQQLLQIQEQAILSGATFVSQDNVYNNVRGLIEDANLGNPNDYLTDPATVPPAPPKPDPAMVKAQADAQSQQTQDQIAVAKNQHEAMLAEQKHAVHAQGVQADVQVKAGKAQADAQLAQQTAAAQADLAHQRMSAEIVMNEQKMSAEMQMAQQRHDQSLQHAEDMNEVKLSANRPGGSLAE